MTEQEHYEEAERLLNIEKSSVGLPAYLRFSILIRANAHANLVNTSYDA